MVSQQTMLIIPATVGHVFPRFLRQFSTDFHAILQGLHYFRVPRQIFIRNVVLFKS